MKCSNPGLAWQAGFEGAGLWDFALCQKAVFPWEFQRFWAEEIPVTEQWLTQGFHMILGCVFRYWAPKWSIIHSVYKALLIHFRAVIKLLFYQGKSRFWFLWKYHQECMINIRGFVAFCVPFAELASKMIKKRQVLQCILARFCAVSKQWFYQGKVCFPHLSKWEQECMINVMLFTNFWLRLRNWASKWSIIVRVYKVLAVRIYGVRKSSFPLGKLRIGHVAKLH